VPIVFARRREHATPLRRLSATIPRASPPAFSVLKTCFDLRREQTEVDLKWFSVVREADGP
jgi:hypothetical protein